jgi:hypothetical protein
MSLKHVYDFEIGIKLSIKKNAKADLFKEKVHFPQKNRLEL